MSQTLRHGGRSQPIDQPSTQTSQPVSQSPVQTDSPVDQPPIQTNSTVNQSPIQSCQLVNQPSSQEDPEAKQPQLTEAQEAFREISAHFEALQRHVEQAVVARDSPRSAASRSFQVTRYNSAAERSHADFETPQLPSATFDYISVSNAGRYGSQGDTSRKNVAMSYDRPVPHDAAHEQQSMAPGQSARTQQLIDAGPSHLDICDINDDLRNLGIRPIRRGEFVDHLAFTSLKTPEKVTREDHVTGKHSEEEFGMALDLGQPKHNNAPRADVQGWLPLRIPGDREPWAASKNTQNLYAAHNVGFMESLSQHRRGSSDPSDTSSAISEVVEDETAQSSWKRRQMISRLQGGRQGYLRRHAGRTAAFNGEERGARNPLTVDSHSAAEYFMARHDASVTGRRVAIDFETPTYETGMAEAQAKMRNLLADLGNDQGDGVEGKHELSKDYQELLPTLVRRARPMPMSEGEIMHRRQIDGVPSERGTDDVELTIEHAAAIERRKALEASWASQQEVVADEEYDKLDINTPDELEHYFDQPNVRVGIFDQDEVAYWTGKQFKKQLNETRRRADGAADRAAILQRMGMGEKELNQVIETHRQKLVKTAKLLPPTLAQAQRTSSSASSRPHSTQKSTASATPTRASRKRKASTVEPDSAGSNSMPGSRRQNDSGPSDGHANGCLCSSCTPGTAALLDEVNRRLTTSDTAPAGTGEMAATPSTTEESTSPVSSSGRQIKKPKFTGE